MLSCFLVLCHLFGYVIWWSKEQLFHTSSTSGSTTLSKPLGSGPLKFRNLCRTLAGCHFWCFADFLDENRCWPSSTAFFTKVSSALHPFLGSKIVPQDIFLLYRQLTQVFRRVLPHPEAGGVQVVTSTSTPPAIGIMVPNSAPTEPKVRFFPYLRAQDWTKLLQKIPDLIHHPMENLGCSRQFIHRTLSSFLSLRGFLLPVVHDVMLRLYFGDLIVGSRLYVLRSLNPTIQQCVRPTCQAIETVEHCFYGCPALSPMWRQIWAPWARVFRKPLNWQLLLFPKPQDIHSSWKRNQKGLLLLWKVQTAIVFRATWRLRNDIHFRQTEAQIPNVPNMQMFFKMHYQFIYQYATDLHYDRSTIEMLTQQLGFDPPRDVLPERVHNIWIPRV